MQWRLSSTEIVDEERRFSLPDLTRLGYIQDRTQLLVSHMAAHDVEWLGERHWLSRPDMPPPQAGLHDQRVVVLLHLVFGVASDPQQPLVCLFLYPRQHSSSPVQRLFRGCLRLQSLNPACMEAVTRCHQAELIQNPRRFNANIAAWYTVKHRQRLEIARCAPNIASKYMQVLGVTDVRTIRNAWWLVKHWQKSKKEKSSFEAFCFEGLIVFFTMREGATELKS